MLQRLKELLFTNRSTRQTVAKNAFWLSVSNIGGRLIRAVIIIYAARALGATEFGVFSYALGLAGFFTIFADIGINNILTRNVAREPAQEKEIFATAFWMKMALLLLTGAAIIIGGPYISKIEAAIPLIPLVAFLVIADGIREFSNSYFRAKEKMELEAFVTTGMNVVITILGFFALFYYKTSYALTISYVGSAAAGTLFGILILREEFRNIVRGFRRELIKPIIKSALPIALLAVMGAFMLNTDMVMLGWLRSAEDIGWYAAAQKIVQLLYVIPTIFAASIFPLLSRLIATHHKDQERGLVEKSVSFSLLVALPLAVGGILISSPLLSFLYGTEYIPASLTFQILILSVFFVFPGTLLGNFIFAHDLQKRFAPFVLLASIGNIALNALLIPLLGPVGAALATLVVQIIYNATAWWIAKRITHFEVAHYLIKPTIAAIAMGLSVFMLNAIGIHVLIMVAVAAIVYAATLFFLRDHLFENILSIIRSTKTTSPTDSIVPQSPLD